MGHLSQMMRGKRADQACLLQSILEPLSALNKYFETGLLHYKKLPFFLNIQIVEWHPILNDQFKRPTLEWVWKVVPTTYCMADVWSAQCPIASLFPSTKCRVSMYYTPVVGAGFQSAFTVTGLEYLFPEMYILSNTSFSGSFFFENCLASYRVYRILFLQYVHTYIPIVPVGSNWNIVLIFHSCN